MPLMIDLIKLLTSFGPRFGPKRGNFARFLPRADDLTRLSGCLAVHPFTLALPLWFCFRCWGDYAYEAHGHRQPENDHPRRAGQKPEGPLRDAVAQLLEIARNY